jgi:hypothetical protein
VRIPAQEVTTWGTIILLSIPIYPFHTLKELALKFHQDDPGWETLGIGLYGSIFSRILFFVSIAVLPVTAVGDLAIGGVARSVAISGTA